MKRPIHRLCTGERPGQCRGASTALQLTGLGIAATIALYAMGLVLAPPPVPSFPPAAEEARVSSAASAQAPQSLGHRSEAAPAAGQVSAGEPGRDVAPTLANGSQWNAAPLPATGGLRSGNAQGSTPWSQADQLVDRLADIRHRYDAAPLESDHAIRQILDQLRSLGEGAIPAMRRFLTTGEDLAFDLVTADGRPLDSKSLRLALLEMLGAMEGMEAAGALEAEMLRTRYPGEVESIARMLEHRYPGEYRTLAVDRAYDLLQKIWSGDLENADAAPLYQVLAQYGGAEVIAELKQSGGAWPYYRAVALTQAPDGSGMASLIGVWQQTGDPILQRLATQLLAQSAGRDPQAAEAFVKGVADGKVTVPDHLWPKLGQALTGRYDLQLLKPDVGELPAEVERNPYRTIQVGGSEGTTTVYITDVQNISPEERRARLEVVEQLLGEELGPAARSLI